MVAPTAVVVVVQVATFHPLAENLLAAALLQCLLLQRLTALITQFLLALVALGHQEAGSALRVQTQPLAQLLALVEALEDIRHLQLALVAQAVVAVETDPLAPDRATALVVKKSQGKVLQVDKALTLVVAVVALALLVQQ